jgi:outer membrane protein assembly factor BamB
LFRVLAPGGVLLTRRDGRWIKSVKPRPAEIDDWSHALYDASNNAVSRDQLVAPPRTLRWVAEPRNARHHETLGSVTVAVAAGGRLFSIIDEAPAASILLPARWHLVARDAFSGVLLWKRPLGTWESHLWGAQNGPPELGRRLVATPDRVFVTLGLESPVTALDPATGKTLLTYAGTEAAEELIHCDGVLYLVVRGKTKQGTAEVISQPGRSSTAQRFLWSRSAQAGLKTILALEITSGRPLWRSTDLDVLPVSLAVREGRVFWLAPDALVCVDARTGDKQWRAPRQAPRQRPTWSAPTLVVRDGVALCADRRAATAPDVDESTGKPIARWMAAGAAPGDLVAYSVRDGRELWNVKCAEAYHAPIDVLVHQGLVWVGQSRARFGPDFTRAFELQTGAPHDMPPRAQEAFQTTMPHHRCHRNRATERFLLLGRTGVEFIDFNSGEAFRHHWTRGTCQFGVIPANGLLYVPPHSCACYIEAKILGYNALAPAASQPLEMPAAEPLEAGQTYSLLPSQEEEDDWPTYRHDAVRSGRTAARISADLGVAWQARLSGKLTGPVIAAGRALVAASDAHTLSAFDAREGQPLWQFTAGGRIDSPPTMARGLAVFGCADGWVYCLRAADGQLVWRHRVAPQERRLVAYGQIESAWPVSGSTLVRDDAVYCAAGRTSYLDGGIRLVKLDLASGRQLAEKRICSRHPQTGRQPDEPSIFEMPGAQPDILSCDGQFVYMRHLAFDPRTLEPCKAPAHLYSPAGFLNDDWWHRTYWLYGEHFYSGYIGWYFAGRETPAGRILTLDDRAVYGFGYKPDYYRTATDCHYGLFAVERPMLPKQPPADYARANRDYPASGQKKFVLPLKWTRDVPLLARAMLLAGDTLLLAGPPAEALQSLPAYEGAKGAMLFAISAADGRTLAEYPLDCLPVFDGLAVAGRRVCLSLQDGRLLCLTEKSLER